MIDKHEILERYFKDVWEDGNLDAIDDYFHPDSGCEGIVPDRRTEPAEIRQWITIIRRLVRNIKVEIVKSIQEDDWISAFLVVYCDRTDRETDTEVVVYHQIILRFSGRHMVESYPQFDFLRFFERIGLLPENSYAFLMGGNKLT